MNKRLQSLSQARRWERLAGKYRDRKHVGGKYSRKAKIIRRQYGYDAGEALVRVTKGTVKAFEQLADSFSRAADALTAAGVGLLKLSAYSHSLPTISVGVVGDVDCEKRVTINASKAFDSNK